MATSDAPLNVPNVTLAVARGAAPPPATGQRVISGTGFGGGPNVVLFHRGKDDPEAVVGMSDPEIGKWNDILHPPELTQRYFTANGRGWLKGNEDPASTSITRTGLRALLAQDYAEFTIAYRNLIPSGYKFPGASAPGVKDNESSNWKPMWPSSIIDGPDNYAGPLGGGADLVLGTHVLNDIILTGNNVEPKKANGEVVYWPKPFDIASERLTVYYQSGDESSEGADDAVMEWILQDDNGALRETFLGDTFNPKREPLTSAGYGALQLNPWQGNFGANSAEDVLVLAGDIYWAVGSNSRCMIFTGNASTFDACTQVHLIPPDRDAQGNPLWVDDEIRFTPESHEALPYTHIKLANGTWIENAEGV